MKRFGLFFIPFFLLAASAYSEDGEMKTSPLGVVFGSQPDMRSIRLSPDGNKIVFIQYHPDGFDFIRSLDLSTKQASGVLFAGTRDGYDIDWCDWANDERIVCGISTMTSMMGNYFPQNRLMAVNADGKDLILLYPEEFQQQGQSFGSFRNMGGIVDWMVDDPEHVKIMDSSTNGSGLGKLNIYTGKYKPPARNRPSVYNWVSDNYGEPRLHFLVSRSVRRWNVRGIDSEEWQLLHEVKADDFTNSFIPLGFSDDRNELLVFDDNNGRRALFSMDLRNNNRKQLVFAHDEVDVQSMQSIGKYNRAVAAVYMDGKLHRHYFDEALQEVHRLIATTFPNHSINVFDEDWNRRYYLVFVSDEVNPGIYFRFDSNNKQLMPLGAISSKLKGHKLSPVTKISYTAGDGTAIPAYLSLPSGKDKGIPLPTVVLLRGGQSSLEDWGFEILVQFLNASGYAVLQANYRGTSGFGREWQGMGPIARWKTATGDVNLGTQFLVDEGIADPERICVAGWANGGYMALLSAIENSSLYKCIISIAGISDPESLMNRGGGFGFGGGNQAQGQSDNDVDVADDASPLDRVTEIKSPVFLAHGERDFAVPFDQSEKLSTAIRKQLKLVEFVRYEDAVNSIRPQAYRIDLLTRMSEFLGKHMK